MRELLRDMPLQGGEGWDEVGIRWELSCFIILYVPIQAAAHDYF